MKARRRTSWLWGWLVFASAAAGAPAPGRLPAVMVIRERIAAVNEITLKRLENLLPRLLREQGFDMWLIPSSEAHPDAVLRSMVPYDSWHRRTPMVMIFDRGPERGVERLNVSRMGMKEFFARGWDYRAHDRDGGEDQWECLRRLVRERDPRRIGINESGVIWAADGLSAGLKRRLLESLEPPYRDRLESAETLATLWLEKFLPEEFDLMGQAVAVSRAIIVETYSNRVITPGRTTVDDLAAHYWQRILDLGLREAFTPGFSIIRSPEDRERYGAGDRVIRRGDIIHCDVGLVYLRYHTDHQEVAYVLRRGESDVPAGLKAAMAEANRLQDIFCGEFRAGRTGNQLLAAILGKARALGVPSPRVYSHSLGYCAHEPGPLIGLPEEQENTGGRGEVPLVPDSAFAAEMSVGTAIPEWGGRTITLGLEQDIVFTGTGVDFLGGRQTDFHVIR